jgi:FAD/FMN-containing dehydrogenase
MDIKALLLDVFPKRKLDDRDGLAVLSADGEGDVVNMVNLAIRHRLRISPVGSMTHFALTSAESDCVLVSSLRMTKLVDYSAGDLYVTLQSGSRLAEVNGLVADDGLRFPFGHCGYAGTLGGAVALGLSGRIGSEPIHIRRWVTALSFVTPYGKHLKVGSVTLKSVAGYDIPKLLVGSMGRFGFITSVTLRLTHRSHTSRFQRMVLDTPRVCSPSWNDSLARLSPAERNLKENIDPHRVFPLLV